MTDQAHREMLVEAMAQIIDPEIVRQMARPGPAWVNRTTLAREKTEAILDALTTGPAFEAMVELAITVAQQRSSSFIQRDWMTAALRAALGATG